jgi:hypothetical protein
MAIELEKTDDGYIQKERKLPGTVHIEGKDFVYFSDNGTEDFRKQFLTLVTRIKPPHQKEGGVISQACRVRLQDGTLFHGISYRGDMEGWRRQIEDGAKELGVLLGRIQDDRIVVSDGRSMALIDCKLEID